MEEYGHILRKVTGTGTGYRIVSLNGACAAALHILNYKPDLHIIRIQRNPFPERIGYYDNFNEKGLLDESLFYIENL